MKNIFYNVACFIARGFSYIFYGLKKPDNKLVPKDGGIIICANHPTLLDPIFIAQSFDRKLTFMSKKELFKFKPFAYILSSLGAFPIDRGNSDISAIKTAIKLLRSGHAMLLFPQGTRAKKEDNTKGKHGAIRLAILTGASIVPVGLSDNPKAFRKKAFVNIGNPIDYSSYKGVSVTDEDYDRLTDELMNTIYLLAEGK